ncbi:MAG: hypothetical protein AAGA56_23310 [Myxococcota bacterium]
MHEVRFEDGTKRETIEFEIEEQQTKTILLTFSGRASRASARDRSEPWAMNRRRANHFKVKSV